MVLDRRRVALIEDGEAHAIETHQALDGAEPEITVTSLQQCLNAVLRQALLGPPDIMPILRDGLFRTDGERAAAERQCHEDGEPRRDPHLKSFTTHRHRRSVGDRWIALRL